MFVCKRLLKHVAYSCVINLFKILQLLCNYNKCVEHFIMQCRDLSSDDCLTWKHWNKVKGDASFQPVYERSPHLSLELHPINNLSLVLPHSDRLSILVDARSLNFFLQQVKKHKSPRCDFLWCNYMTRRIPPGVRGTFFSSGFRSSELYKSITILSEALLWFRL